MFFKFEAKFLLNWSVFHYYFVNCPRKVFKLSLQSTFAMFKMINNECKGYPLAMNFKSVSWKSLLSNISDSNHEYSNVHVQNMGVLSFKINFWI